MCRSKTNTDIPLLFRVAVNEDSNADIHAGVAEVAGLSPFAFSVVVGTVATLPLMFIPSFKRLSWLSLLGCISTVVVTVTVIAAVAMDPLRKKMPQQVSPPPLHHCAPVPMTDPAVTMLRQSLHSLCAASIRHDCLSWEGRMAAGRVLSSTPSTKSMLIDHEA